MKDKSKVIIAVIAVVMMISCALVPATCQNDTVGTDAETQGDEYSAFSLEDLIKKMKEDCTDLSFGNVRLIPVGTTDISDVETLPTTITGEGAGTIASGQVKQPTNKATTTFNTSGETDYGRILVKDGGTLVLFPVDLEKILGGIDLKYTFHNDNKGTTDGSTGKAPGDVIVLEIGSKLSIFGKTFTIQAKEESKTDPFTLLAMRHDTWDAEGWKAYVNDTECSFTINLDMAARTIHVGFDVTKEKTRVRIAESFEADYNKDNKTDDIYFDATFTASLDTGIVVNINGKIVIDWVSNADTKTAGEGTVEVNVGFGQDTEKGITKISIAGKLSGFNMTVKETIDKIEKLRMEIKNGVIDVGKIDFTCQSTSAENGVTKYVIDLVSEKDLVIGFEKIWLDLSGKEVDAKEETIEVNNIAFKVSNTNLHIDAEMNGTEITKLNSATATTSLAITVGKIDAEIFVVKATVKDVEISINGLSVNMTSMTDGTATLESVVVKATVDKNLKLPLTKTLNYTLKYDVMLEVKVYDVVASMNSTGGAISKASGLVKLGMKCDGTDRKLEVGFINASGGLSPTKEISTIKVESIYLSNSLSFEALDHIEEKTPGKITEYIRTIRQLMIDAGLGNGEITITATNVEYTYKSGSYFPEKIGSLTLDISKGVRYKTLHIEYPDVKKIEPIAKSEPIEYGFNIECTGTINGYFISYAGVQNNFNIAPVTDAAGATVNPKAGLSVEIILDAEGKFSYGIGYVNLEQGNANFDAGVLPLGIWVANGVKFHANGLTAPSFEFNNAVADRSGTISIDMNAFKLYKGEMYVLDKVGDYDITVMEKGAKFNFNPADMLNGTVTTDKGYDLTTAWTSKDGKCTVTPTDNSNGVMKINGSGDTVIVADVKLCAMITYTLDYKGITVEQQTYKYNDTVTIVDTKPEAKEGYHFCGWSDGSGTIYESGSKYTMPARNVMLLPVYAKDIEKAEVSAEGNINIVTDASAVVVKLPASEWKTITISTDDGKAVTSFTSESLQSVLGEGEKADSIRFSCIKTDSYNHEEIAEIVGEHDLYSMHLQVKKTGTEEFTDIENYNGSSVFKVTVNAHADDRTVLRFKIQYINESCVPSDVGFDKLTKKSDGTYDVTFYTNHFSLYTVEPVYGCTVTYDIDGGTGTAPTQDPVEMNGTFTVKGIGDVTKQGYTFGGWTIVGDTSGKIYKEGDTITAGESDIVLKAVWNKNAEPAPSTDYTALIIAIIVILAIVAVGGYYYYRKTHQ